jgi:hypothetical protein
MANQPLLQLDYATVPPRFNWRRAIRRGLFVIAILALIVAILKIPEMRLGWRRYTN